MKKITVLFSLALMMVGFAFADSIDLGNFPLGKWLDHNYDAVWEFSSGNIKITDVDGSIVYCDFSEKTMNDWTVGVEGTGATLTFECPETGRTYKFTKGLDSSLTLEIDRSDLPHYSVVMEKQ